jgi:DNA-binding MarR family transcriptional regulator
MRTSAVAHLRLLNHSADLRDDVANALQAVRALVQVLSESARTVESRTGVTNAQLFLLQQIRAEPSLTVNDLASRAMTHQSTVSIVLSRLERRGLVERARSPTDGRSVVLRLTPRGRRLLRRAPMPATSEALEALGKLTRPELRALTRGLSALGRELGFSSSQPGMLFEQTGRGAKVPRRTSQRSVARKGARAAR